MQRNVTNKIRWIAVLVTLLIFSSCKKDISPSSQSGQSSLSENNSSLYKNGTVFASSNGIGAGTNYPFPFNVGGERVIGMNMPTYGIYQLLCYAAGTGLIGMYYNSGSIAQPVFTNMYWNRTGIVDQLGQGTYDLASASDKVIPYDLDGIGTYNYIICYRPGAGMFWIFKWNQKGTGSPWMLILKSSIGVGVSGTNFDLSSAFDIVQPFDFYHTGRATSLICYRPGTGKIWIMVNNGVGTPNFIPVLQSNTGIGTGANAFTLAGTMDQLVPWDVSHTGKQDGILGYRTGGGIIGTYTHSGTSGAFTNAQYSSTGIPPSIVYPNIGYDLKDPALNDRIIRYWTSGGEFGSYTGAMVTRAGKGLAYGYQNLDINNNNISFLSQGNGIGSGSIWYPLNVTSDQVYAFDGGQNGQPNTLCCWRPHTGLVWLIYGDFTKVF